MGLDVTSHMQALTQILAAHFCFVMRDVTEMTSVS